MVTSERGAFKIFQAFGIKVWLHWSWFLIAAYQLQNRRNTYHSMAWNVAEYLSLFGIVLMHEFGHALACKQVGGSADEIILWPLGGIAYVRPPNRPGAQLWSLAAGPLVNALLVPVLFGVNLLCEQFGIFEGNPDFARFVHMLQVINLVLLCFNMLPIYPLDGGQIFRSLLWFVIGPVRSLYTAVAVGFVGALVGAYVVMSKSSRDNAIWFGVLAFFAASRCWAGFQYARSLGRLEKIPRHEEYACPKCGEAPFVGDNWLCQCGARFDPFVNHTVCPQCHKIHQQTACPSCRETSDFLSWRRTPPL